MITRSRFNCLSNQNRDNKYFITKKISFHNDFFLEKDDLLKSFSFAYSMTFGNDGTHRNHRSGGTHKRKNGEIFINAFQGKMAEFAFYRLLLNNNIDCPNPEIDTWGAGVWDSSDFIVQGKKINIKSTKFYGNLLLLESKDWNNDGAYIPNLNTKEISFYDFFILLRIKPDGEKIMKANRFYYSDKVHEENLKNIIFSQNWEYDFPGFITHRDLKTVIAGRQILPQGAMLNGNTRMDAENYYIQCGDMQPINSLLSKLNDEK